MIGDGAGDFSRWPEAEAETDVEVEAGASLAGAVTRSDMILPFQVEPYALRGRLVTLAGAVDRIITSHAHPEPVARLQAELLALAPCLAHALKYDGVFTLQLTGTGPLKTLMADVTSDGGLRGYAGYDPDGVARIVGEHGPDASLHRLTGGGYLAFTVDQGAHAERYQGIVELSGPTLAECTHAYFRSSEQLQTAISVAAAPPEEGEGGWRASALMIQRLAYEGGSGPTGIDEGAYDEGWRTAVILMSSAGPEELLDPALAPDRLLWRLFHETGVRVYPEQKIEARCRCSAGKVERVLRSLDPAELADMQVDGVVSVVCEFCKTARRYDAEALATLRGPAI